jgi:hypothetical protein
VPRKKKAANLLTDKQLVKRLFPPAVRKELKRVLADIDGQAEKRLKQARKRKS